jgi:signal transduction histidine kinase
MTDEICLEKAATPRQTAEASPDEFLTFERLLVDLSARFANVSGDQVETEIESTLRQLIEFLDFDRGGFGEFTADGWYTILCSAGRERVEGFPLGPAPAFLSWYLGQIRAGKIVRVRSINDLPPEATGEIDYFRRSGMRSNLSIPLRISGRIVGALAFSAFRSTREWPDELIARLKIIGEVLAQAVVRKRSEAELRKTQTKLADITRLTTMHALTASIAHEVKQPLAAVVTNANAGLRWLTKKTPDLDEARAALQGVIDAGHLAVEVIESIRAMFKKIDQELAPLDINKLIRDVLVLMETRAHEVSIQTDLKEDLPNIMGNRVQLQQVILNLITNALDAMHAVTNRPRVLRLRSENHQPDGVLVSVEDSGTGIDPKDVERIFNSFYTTKSQGMGIGLSLCQSVIEAHNGRLWVSSSGDQGSVFNILLPAAVTTGAE